MLIKSTIRAVIALALLAGLDVSQPAAGAERADCGQACPSDNVSIYVPGGWMHDATAERRLRLTALVREGQSFTTTDAFILATVLANPDKRPIADYIAQNQAAFRARTSDLKIAPLADVARSGGKEGFRVFQYEKPSARTQRFERIATTTDIDKDGKSVLVTISLTADSLKSLEAAEQSYLEILRDY
jgi:hypothetical protein